MTDTPKRGRPSSYTQEIADEICDRMMNGESLRSICELDGMPTRAAVFRWLAKADQDGADPEMVAFRDQYARARQEQADAIFDDCLRIADDATNDYMENMDGGGAVGYKLNGEHIQRSRLRIDTRKWMAGKLRPKKYGEKITQEVTGKDGGPIETKDQSDNDIARKLALALAQGNAERQER